MRAHQLLKFLMLERRSPGEALVKHAGQRVDVGLGPDTAFGKPFGRHVGTRPDQRSARRDAGIAAGVSDAEVDKVGEVIGSEQHVLRLDVAVHQPLGVRGVQRGRHLRGDFRRPHGFECALRT